MAETAITVRGTRHPIVRYVYLVRDVSDAARMGGTAENTYTTFQTAYDAANALQILLGGASTVVIQVGNTTSASVGSLVLTANYNASVELVGISSTASIVGSITNSTFNIVVSVSNITVGALTTNGGLISVFPKNAVVGNLITTSTTGASGNILVANGYNSTVGALTANASLGNCGTISFSSLQNVSAAAISTIQSSTIASFSVGAFTITNCAGLRFTTYSASMAFATSTGTVGGLNINNTNSDIRFSGVVIIQGFTNLTLATSDVVVTNFIANNTTFNGNVLVNSRDILSAVSETGGTISNVNIKSCVFNGARVRFFYNATTNANITASYTLENCQFNNTVSATGGIYCKVFNTTFTTMRVEDCYVLGAGVGIAIENSLSPVPLLTGTSLVINGITGSSALVLVNVVQDDLGFDEVIMNNVNVFHLEAFITDGDATFNIKNSSTDLFLISSSSASLTKRSKYINCNGNIESDGNVLLTISGGSDLVFVSLTSNFNVDVYSSTVNFYALGAITIAGTLFTSNIIRQNTSTLTATLNNSWDESIP